MATPTASVPGIGKATAFALSRHGFRSAEDLAAADEDVLAAVPGFGVSRAATVIESARKLVGLPAGATDAAPAEMAETAEPPAEEKVEKAEKKKPKAGGKAKAKKKDKKKDKKKFGKAKKKSG